MYIFSRLIVLEKEEKGTCLFNNHNNFVLPYVFQNLIKVSIPCHFVFNRFIYFESLHLHQSKSQLKKKQWLRKYLKYFLIGKILFNININKRKQDLNKSKNLIYARKSV